MTRGSVLQKITEISSFRCEISKKRGRVAAKSSKKIASFSRSTRRTRKKILGFIFQKYSADFFSFFVVFF